MPTLITYADPAIVLQAAALSDAHVLPLIPVFKWGRDDPDGPVEALRLEEVIEADIDGILQWFDECKELDELWFTHHIPKLTRGEDHPVTDGAISRFGDLFHTAADFYREDRPGPLMAPLDGHRTLARMKAAIHVGLEIQEIRIAVDSGRKAPAESPYLRHLRARFGPYPDSAARPGRFYSDSEFAIRWLREQVAEQPMNVVMLNSETEDTPARMAPVPATGVALCFWVAAVTGQAIEPGFPIHGVHVCGNCRRPFAADRRRANGRTKNYFCSTWCGQTFHKRESARRRRARSASS